MEYDNEICFRQTVSVFIVGESGLKLRISSNFRKIRVLGGMQQVLKHNNIFLIFYTVIYHTGDTGKHHTVNTVQCGGTLRIQ